MKISLMLAGILAFSNFAFATSAKLPKNVSETKRKISQEADTCSLNFLSGISALIDAKSNKLSSYIGIAKDTAGKIQMEAVVLANGRQLVVTSGGCAHVAHGFNYSTTGINTDAKAVDAIVNYLAATPTTQVGSDIKKIWITALKKWKEKPTASKDKVIYFGNTDATLTLNYSNKDLLQIEYDFAL